MAFFPILTVVGIAAYKERKLIRRNPKGFIPHLCAIAFLFAVLSAASDHQVGNVQDYFRKQFHLPKDVTFDEMSLTHDGRAPTRAAVTFSDEGWDDFVAGLNDPSRATPFLFDFSADPVQHAKIAHWRFLPSVTTGQAYPNSLLNKPELFDASSSARVRSGKILCITYVAKTSAGAKTCYERFSQGQLRSYLIAVLDLERKQLHARYKD